MADIIITRKLAIFGIGLIGNLFILLILYALFSQLLVDFVIGNISNQVVLGLIILGLMMISLIISIPISLWITNDVKRRVIYKSMLVSFIGTFIILYILSYVSLFYLYPDVFSEVEGLFILLIFPQVIMNFSIYVLSHPFYLVIIVGVIYFALYVVFLDFYYEAKITSNRQNNMDNPRYR
jgi:hypothetical protein